MQFTLRPYMTAGLALTAAGAIAVAPLTVSSAANDVAASNPANSSVELSASWDIITPWIEAFNTASENATALAQWNGEAPAAAFQQFIVNKFRHLNTLINDPTAIGEVFQTIATNVHNAFEYATILGDYDYDMSNPESGELLGQRLLRSNDMMHGMFAGMMPIVLAEDMDPQTVKFVSKALNFISSPVSGVLIGLAGPVVSPVVALLNNIQSAVNALRTDPAEALSILVNTPADMVDAFFNGATLDLSFAVPLLSGVLPAGTTMNSLNIAFGGLFSTGETGMDAAGNFVPSYGGSIFNSVGMDITTDMLGAPSTMYIPGKPVGPIAAIANLSRVIAMALGWDGVGNPLTDLRFPTLDSDDATTDAPEGPAALPPAAAQLVTFDLSSGESPELVQSVSAGSGEDAVQDREVIDEDSVVGGEGVGEVIDEDSVVGGEGVGEDSVVGGEGVGEVIDEKDGGENDAQTQLEDPKPEAGATAPASSSDAQADESRGDNSSSPEAKTEDRDSSGGEGGSSSGGAGGGDV